MIQSSDDSVSKPDSERLNTPKGSSRFWSYDHLMTTRPHGIRQVMISDLHLSNDEPALVQAFSALLDDLIVLPKLHRLYVLGDWFDMWIGDDAYLDLTDHAKQRHWLTPLITKLRKLYDSGCQTLVMHGNRDFLIGQTFCDTFHGKLIGEPYIIHIGNESVRLEHGDALCTDDVAYQRLRRVLRARPVQWLLLKRPLAKRQQLANNIKLKSAQGKSHKSADIMDVNKQTVNKAMQHSNILLHGHTHRPDTHSVNGFKTRYILGDWRLIRKAPHSKPKVEAIIGMTVVDMDSDNSNPATHAGEQLHLVRFEY